MAKAKTKKDELVVKDEETKAMSVFGHRENPDLPDFMKGETETGVEDLGQYIVPPRLKIVQKQSDDELLEQFNVGDVILVPQNVLVAPVKMNDAGRPSKEGSPFLFTPVFFFPEWVAWNPIEARGTLPAIQDRTTDPDDPLVARCRNSKLWFDELDLKDDKGNPLFRRNTEHLNFIVTLLDGDLAGTTCIMSFSRAEHKSGSSFAALTKMRKGPLYGMVFQAQTGPRDNNKGEWRGFDIGNPEGSSGWIEDKESYEHLRELHMEFKSAHADRLIRPDYEDDSEVVADAPSEF